MLPTVWSCTTTIGLLEFYIRVRLKVTHVWRKIQEAQSNDLLRTARLSMRLYTPLHGNNARCIKCAVYYAHLIPLAYQVRGVLRERSNAHSVRKYKMAALSLCSNKKGPVASLACLFPVNSNSSYSQWFSTLEMKWFCSIQAHQVKANSRIVQKSSPYVNIDKDSKPRQGETWHT